MNLIDISKKIQKEILDDWLNFQDMNKDIYWICEIDSFVIEHLEADILITVLNFDKNFLHLLIDEKYEVFIKLSENEKEYEWIIEYAKKVEI